MLEIDMFLAQLDEKTKKATKSRKRPQKEDGMASQLQRDVVT